MSNFLDSLTRTAQSINRTVNPSTIDSFKSMIENRHGIARPNRFLVTMKPPSQTLFSGGNVADMLWNTIVAGNNLSYRDFVTDPRDIAMLCENSAFPGKQIQTVDYSYGLALTKKVPMALQNEDVTMVFHLTNDYYAKKIFTQWSNLVINPKTYHANYENTYKTDVIIQQLDNNNIPSYGVRLKGAYPIGVNSIPLDTNDAGTCKLSVTFTFDDQMDESAQQSTFEALNNTVTGFLTRLI